jgi:alpha-tubulin suppressor-like RCC1 family protein
MQVAGVTGATAVTVGFAHACALRSDGSIQCWGNDSSGELGDGMSGVAMSPVVTAIRVPPATAIAAGEDYTCAIVASGKVFCWGYGRQGQLGDGMFLNNPDSDVTPAEVVGL